MSFQTNPLVSRDDLQVQFLYLVECLKNDLPLLKRIHEKAIQKVLENYEILGISTTNCYREISIPGQAYLVKPRHEKSNRIDKARVYGFSFPGSKATAKEVVKVECGIRMKPTWKAWKYSLVQENHQHVSMVWVFKVQQDKYSQFQVLSSQQNESSDQASDQPSNPPIQTEGIEIPGDDDSTDESESESKTKDEKAESSPPLEIDNTQTPTPTPTPSTSKINPVPLAQTSPNTTSPAPSFPTLPVPATREALLAIFRRPSPTTEKRKQTPPQTTASEKKRAVDPAAALHRLSENMEPSINKLLKVDKATQTEDNPYFRYPSYYPMMNPQYNQFMYPVMPQMFDPSSQFGRPNYPYIVVGGMPSYGGMPMNPVNSLNTPLNAIPVDPKSLQGVVRPVVPSSPSTVTTQPTSDQRLEFLQHLNLHQMPQLSQLQPQQPQVPQMHSQTLPE